MTPVALAAIPLPLGISFFTDPVLIAREKPDVVVDEMVERAMFGPVATPMPGAAAAPVVTQRTPTATPAIAIER